MAALFRSAKDSLYVMLTIPLASFGGVLGLWVLRLFTFQTLDLLTMIGFVVLMGLVVNNAILLTDETRAGEREGLSRARRIAGLETRTRTRPIMSITLTTLLGMLPMVVVPGSRQRALSRTRGSDLRRHGTERRVHSRRFCLRIFR